MRSAKKENDAELRRLLASNITSLESDNRPKAAAESFEGDVNGVQRPFYLLHDWNSGKVYMVPRDEDDSDEKKAMKIAM